jgi:hypothetical protein
LCPRLEVVSARIFCEGILHRDNSNCWVSDNLGLIQVVADFEDSLDWSESDAASEPAELMAIDYLSSPRTTRGLFPAPFRCKRRQSCLIRVAPSRLANDTYFSHSRRPGIVRMVYRGHYWHIADMYRFLAMV